VKEKEITRRLRVLRADKNLSQQRVARRARISSLNRYWRIEAGLAVPTEKEQERIAKVFGLAPFEVFPPDHPASDEDSLAGTDVLAEIVASR
jgi:transcriptional regulator with XRE-family HTH domain